MGKMLKLSRKASSVMEYAIALGIVSMALTTMSVYFKRGIQARTKDLTTALIVNDLYLSGSGTHQYVANTTQSDSNITMSNTNDQTTVNKVTTNDISETITRTANDSSVMSGWEDCLTGPC